MYFNIDGKDLPVVSASLKWGQNAPAEANIGVLAAMFDWRNARFKDVELWKDGKRVFNGYVFDSPQLSFGDGKAVVATLGCVDDLGRLTRMRAKSDAHYQNSLITSIIQDLLSSASSAWALSDSSTMLDPLAKTTVDLRSKEHLWAQIIGVMEAVPNLFVRYGGYNPNINTHFLDIGNFNSETSRFIQGANLTSIKLQKSTELPYTTVEAYGGKLSTRKVTLEDALSYPAITSHPDYATYPIQLDPSSGKYVVNDLTPGKIGNQITKSFNLNKTKNDGLPTPVEIAEAGFALWQSTVRFLKKSTLYENYSVSGLLTSPPIVGDRAWLQGSVSEPIYDPVIDDIVWQNTFSVADSYRITKAELNFDKTTFLSDPSTDDLIQVEEYSVEMTDNDYVDDTDDSLNLYSRLEPTSNSDDVPAMLGLLNQQFVTVTFANTAPADTGCGTGTWKKFQFDFVVPEGAVAIYYNILPIETSNATFVINQVPNISGTPLILCVQKGGIWPGTVGDVTIKVQYTFS